MDEEAWVRAQMDDRHPDYHEDPPESPAPRRILVAGIGGGSLGLEIIKCLRMAGGYTIFGADSADLANGHFIGLEQTFVVPRDDFAPGILRLCRDYGIEAVIPGGEVPCRLLTVAAADLRDRGVVLAGNAPDVVKLCADKVRLFQRLAELSIRFPATNIISRDYSASPLPRFYSPPWIVKPASETSGSRGVSLITEERLVEGPVRRILASGRAALVQEYVPLDEGEFTIGILSPSNDGAPVGSVVMRRLFHSKLSVQAENRAGLISSGISQGYIGEFPDLARQAEAIAFALHSHGPLNIQARVRNGVLLPFEINARFSASTYLRCMAGWNEVDVYLRMALGGERPMPQPPIRAGFYLRGLTEMAVPPSVSSAALAGIVSRQSTAPFWWR